MAWDWTWLDATYFGNTLRLWVIAAAIVVGTFLSLEAMKAVLARRLGRLIANSETKVDDLLIDILRAVRVTSIAAVAIYLGTRAVVLPAQAGELVRIGLTIVLAYQAMVWANVLVDRWLTGRFDRPDTSQPAGIGYGAVRLVAQVVLWSVILLLALDNIGVEVTALVAGLGVGGIAVALAVQHILGDVLCSLSIVLDKPFEVGDFIIAGDMMGTVENIGIKTTRVRSLGGEQLVFSNSDLVGSRVRNYKRMWQRRVLFEFGVTYQTTPEQIEKIPTIIRTLVEAAEDTRFDRAHFKSYGDSALIFEVVYFVLLPDYNVYMDKQQEINLGIMRAFAKEGIDFAYPTQTLYLRDDGDARTAA